VGVGLSIMPPSQISLAKYIAYLEFILILLQMKTRVENLLIGSESNVIPSKLCPLLTQLTCCIARELMVGIVMPNYCFFCVLPQLCSVQVP